MGTVWNTARPQRPDYAALHGEHRVDTAIMGGGITGLTTALLLTEAGQRVAVLESGNIGGGSSGGSTGNLYATLSQRLTTVREKWSTDVIRDVVSQRTQAVRFIEETGARLAIDSEFSRRPLFFCITGSDPAKERMLDTEHQASLAAGLEASLVDSAPELPFAIHRALRIERQAQFNPVRYLEGLATEIVRRGGLICENSPVRDMDAGKGVVRTDDGALAAKQIVCATHTPKGINLLQAEMAPYREYGIAAPLDDAHCPRGIFWILDTFRSIRSYTHADTSYLVVVGEKHKTGHDSPGESYYQRLRDFARAHFPITEVVHSWSVQQYASADRLPYIGRGGHDNVYIGTGYGADGLTWGTVAGRMIAAQICGAEPELASLLSPRRFTPLKSAKSWLDDNLAVASHLAKDYFTSTGREHADEVPVGEGRVVTLKGEQLAVYRGTDNSVTTVSAVCPHMKCVVHWNAADTTWDCPCHGSRFGIDGSVIEGPAYRGLAPRQDSR